ncbi:hypothetical protein D3C80_1549880 [compost metagenome]
MTQDALARGAVWRRGGNGRQHLARRRSGQQRLYIRTRQLFELFEPPAEHLDQCLIVLAVQGSEQALADLRIEQPQAESLQVARLEAFLSVVGLDHQQRLLAYPGTFQ